MQLQKWWKFGGNMNNNTFPTTRQREVARKVLQEGKSVSRAMRESGYSPATAKTPKKLTESKGWQELIDQYISEDKLAKVHGQQLQATRVQVYNKKRYVMPDNEARIRALDLGYKLRGKYKPTKIEVRNFSDWTNEELESYATTGIVPERFRSTG